MAEKQWIAIFYNDIPYSVSKAVGELLEAGNTFFKIKSDGKIISIPFQKIVRIEEHLGSFGHRNQNQTFK